MELDAPTGLIHSQVFSVNVPCPSCKTSFMVEVQIPPEQERFPFPILMMHTASWGKREVHCLLAYIDKHGTCRHVELIHGKNTVITPYIVFNPGLLKLFCYRPEKKAEHKG